jgi:hypothetical protein
MRKTNLWANGTLSSTSSLDELVTPWNSRIPPKTSRQLEDESNNTVILGDDQNEMVNVIIGYKTDSQFSTARQAMLSRSASVGVSSTDSKVAWPPGLLILNKFSRIDAEIVRIARKDIPMLLNDDAVAFVEEDGEMHLLAETIPWGIPTIQADDPSIPPPDIANYRSGESCFKICIIDAGMELGHIDLVSALIGPAFCCLATLVSLCWTISRSPNILSLVCPFESHFRFKPETFRVKALACQMTKNGTTRLRCTARTLQEPSRPKEATMWALLVLYHPIKEYVYLLLERLGTMGLVPAQARSIWRRSGAQTTALG